MKYHLTLFLIIFCPSVFAQQITYNQWKEESKTNIRLLPKYGNIPKTKEQKESDTALIKTYLAQQGTPRKASEVLVKLGFDYLYRGDLKTAMYRFNQAWLLDPTNENVFWGFGGIYFSFRDYTNANNQYNEGLAMNPRNVNILIDIATIQMARFETNHNQKDLKSAIESFNKAYGIDNKNHNLLFKLSVCYFLNDDCKNAWKYYDECKKLGGKPITSEYTNALSNKCKR